MAKKKKYNEKIVDVLDLKFMWWNMAELWIKIHVMKYGWTQDSVVVTMLLSCVGFWIHQLTFGQKMLLISTALHKNVDEIKTFAER